MGQVLVGKYLGFTLAVTIIALGLLALMPLLGVPLAGPFPLWLALVLLFVLASLGIGFLLSTQSRSESQAVQLAMLALLLSMFFSGFFLPLDSFAGPVRALAELLPLTHAIRGLQAIMLRGQPPALGTWFGLMALAVVSYGVVALSWRRRFRAV
jgi:ABC-2 type transport system permease protein